MRFRGAPLVRASLRAGRPAPCCRRRPGAPPPCLTCSCRSADAVGVPAAVGAAGAARGAEARVARGRPLAAAAGGGGRTVPTQRAPDPQTSSACAGRATARRYGHLVAVFLMVARNCGLRPAACRRHDSACARSAPAVSALLRALLRRLPPRAVPTGAPGSTPCCGRGSWTLGTWMSRRWKTRSTARCSRARLVPPQKCTLPHLQPRRALGACTRTPWVGGSRGAAVAARRQA